MDVRAPNASRKRTVAVAVGASLLAVLFVAGLAFANSVGAARVADNARQLHWVNASLGTSSLTRAALVQAVTFLELEADGVATADDVAFALDQVRASYDDLADLAASSPETLSDTVFAHFVADVEDAVTRLEDGDLPAARSTVVNDVETSYMSLSDSLRAEQEIVQAAIDENTAAASRTNSYVIFLLTLAIPGAAVIAYWLIARRQVREYRLKSELEIQSEREVSRAKDAFIAGLSHELRTPLTSIYGFAEVLTDGDVEDTSQTRDLAQIIANEAAELTRMVDDLLAASRMESTGIEVEISRTRARDVVESALTPFERAGLSINRPGTDAILMTDGARLRHILVNLISNAVRHGGDRIGIEVSPAEDTVDIEVWDNGSGVPEERIGSLFDRFVHDGAAPLLTGSVGLGLAVASRLTSMLEGRLTYQRFAQKTYFVVSLPSIAVADVETEEESVADVIRAMSS